MILHKQNNNSKNAEQTSDVNRNDGNLIAKRLDVLIRLFIEVNLNKSGKFTLTQFVKAMKSAGLDRKEIATILGKKPTDIDPLLYSSRETKEKETTTEGERENV